MKIVIVGPPYAGKDTQAKLISKLYDIPVFSMGNLIREAYEAKDPRAIEGFEEYSMKGLHVPVRLKFGLLRDQLDANKEGYIIDNFPATNEDLEEFLAYLEETNTKVDKVIHLYISEEGMKKRLVNRGREDDDPSVIATRRVIQDKDRVPVLNYFRENNLLIDINGEGTVDEVHKEIVEALG